MPLDSGVGPAHDPPDVLELYYKRLFASLGPQGWWPATTRLEVIVGAILTQNTSWKNVQLAIRRLRKAGLLTLPRLERASRSEIESCIRPAGFYRQKSRTIQEFLAWLKYDCEGSLGVMFARPDVQLRGELLRLRGLGPETADAILLYAGRRPFFVADTYTRRILMRHKLVAETASYQNAQDLLHRNLPRDHALFNEYHALLVEVGKRWCRSALAHCEECPLSEFLPAEHSRLTAPPALQITRRATNHG